MTLEDIEDFISKTTTALEQVSNDDPAILLASYLKSLSPDFKTAMVDLIREIQGKYCQTLTVKSNNVTYFESLLNSLAFSMTTADIFSTHIRNGASSYHSQKMVMPQTSNEKYEP